ncbi:hypothetical protein IWX76_000452 [Pedobacter sp. CAN_A7]
MKARFTSIILFFLCVLICGCSGLTPIRTYTAASTKGIEALGSITYNFEQHCLASCRDHDLEAFRLTSVDCNCEDSKHADSLNLLMQQAVRAYVLALGQLSGKEVTTLPITALSASIQASPAANLKISQKEIDSYTTIGDLLSNVLSGQYRKNKLKSFVSKGQKPLTILIDYLQLNRSKNLNGLIEVRIQRNKLAFYEYIQDKRYTPYQKREITATYYKIFDQLEEQKLASLYFVQVLEEIKKGHKDLYNNLEAWNNDQLINMMASNAAKIESILRKMENLK